MGRRNRLQVNYGLLTARSDCPVAISVYQGNTAIARRACRRSRGKFFPGAGQALPISRKVVDELRELAAVSGISVPIGALVQGQTLMLGLLMSTAISSFLAMRAALS
jgi:hypothetical protein